MSGTSKTSVHSPQAHAGHSRLMRCKGAGVNIGTKRPPLPGSCVGLATPGRVAAPDRGPCQAGQSSSHWGLGPNPQQMTRCYFAFLCHYFFFRKHGRNGCYGLKRLWVFPVPWLPFPVTVPQAEHNLNTACHLNLRFIILVHSKFSKKKKKKKRILMLFTVP